MTDYWLNKLMFDLQGPGGKDRWHADRPAVLDAYPLKSEIRQALLEDDYAVIQPLANPYLLRFHLLISGYDDDASIALLSSVGKSERTLDG